MHFLKLFCLFTNVNAFLSINNIDMTMYNSEKNFASHVPKHPARDLEKWDVTHSHADELRGKKLE